MHVFSHSTSRAPSRWWFRRFCTPVHPRACMIVGVGQGPPICAIAAAWRGPGASYLWHCRGIAQEASQAALQAPLQAALQAARLGQGGHNEQVEQGSTSMHLIVLAITCFASQLSGLGRVLALGQCRLPALACGLLCRAEGSGAAFWCCVLLLTCTAALGLDRIPCACSALLLAVGCHKQLLSAGFPYTKGLRCVCASHCARTLHTICSAREAATRVFFDTAVTAGMLVCLNAYVPARVSLILIPCARVCRRVSYRE